MRRRRAHWSGRRAVGGAHHHPHLTLKSANHSARKTYAFGHHPDDIGMQSMGQRRVVGLQLLVSICAEFVEYTCHFRLKRSAARLARDQPHLANCRVPAHATYTHEPTPAGINEDTYAAFHDKKHRGSRIPLTCN